MCGNPHEHVGKTNIRNLIYAEDVWSDSKQVKDGRLCIGGLVATTLGMPSRAQTSACLHRPSGQIRRLGIQTDRGTDALPTGKLLRTLYEQLAR